MEVERLIFRDGFPLRVAIAAYSARQRLLEHLAIDLVGGCEQNKRPVAGQSGRLKNIETSNAVRLEIASRISDRGSDRNLRCEVVNLTCIASCALNGTGIADISNGDAQSAGLSGGFLKLFQIVLHALAREIVEDMDASLCID